MRITDNLNIRKIGDEYLILREDGDAGIDLNKAISINETLFFLIDNLKDKDFEEKDALELILDKYEVDEETAKKDLEKIFIELKKHDIVK